jgi:hypothetical protein
VAKLVRLLAKAALWVRIQTSLNGRHKQMSGQYTLECSKYTKKYKKIQKESSEKSYVRMVHLIYERNALMFSHL